MLSVQERVRKVGRCVRDAVLKKISFAVRKLRQSRKPRISDETANLQLPHADPIVVSLLSKTSASSATDAGGHTQQQTSHVTFTGLLLDGESFVAQSILALAKVGCERRVAMLPNAGLLEAIKDVVLENRRAEHAEAIQRKKMGKLFRAHEMIEEELADVESRIARTQQTPGGKMTELNPDLQARLEVLTCKRGKAKAEHKACRQTIDEQYLEQRDTIRKVVYAFERMFVASELLEEEVDAGENESARDAESDKQTCSEISLSTTTSAAASGSRTVRRKPGIQNLKDESGEQVSGNVTLADANRLIMAYRSLRTRLYITEEAFNNRLERFDEEEADRERKIRAGEEVETDSAFDMRQLEGTRGLTRQFIEAEEALEAAKVAAVAAGVQVPGSDVESGFVDDVGDGYRISVENDDDNEPDRGTVEKWLAGVSAEYCEGVPEGEVNVDIDDWDAQSVNMCDSASMVAEGRERRRIGKWRAMCASMKSEEAGGDS